MYLQLTSSRLVRLVLLVLCSSSHQAGSAFGLAPRKHGQQTRTTPSVTRRQVLGCGLLVLGGAPNLATAEILSDDKISLAIEQYGIRPATKDRPQIPLPTSVSTNDKAAVPSKSASKTNKDTLSTSVIQGLLYLQQPNSERRPQATDVILVTVQSVSSSTVLAAAKLPMTRIRLPLRFQVGVNNRVPGQSVADWQSATDAGDLLVTATVCTSPSETDSPMDFIKMCQATRTDNSSGSLPLQATGVSKLLRFAGSSSSETTTTTSIRAPVSLALE